VTARRGNSSMLYAHHSFSGGLDAIFVEAGDEMGDATGDERDNQGVDSNGRAILYIVGGDVTFRLSVGKLSTRLNVKEVVSAFTAVKVEP
jgi:hypothetical protein